MTNIDHQDVEVQRYFTALKKTSNDTEKINISQNIAKLYESSDDYSFSIFSRIIKFVSQSNDKEERKIGLIVLTALGPKLQGTARSRFVNKFHSPIFKLYETTTEESFLPYLEKAYQLILEIGGNRNDSAVETNIMTIFHQISNPSSKDIKKIIGYVLLRILVNASPYITFKKLLYRMKDGGDWLMVISSIARNKNIKVRRAYLSFLENYLQYLADKKDLQCQMSIFFRFCDHYSSIPKKEFQSEQASHLYIETMRFFVEKIPKSVATDNLKTILEYCIDKISNNKNFLNNKSLIELIPALTKQKIQTDVVITFLYFLKRVKGEYQINAQKSINKTIQNFNGDISEISQISKELVKDIFDSFSSLILEKTFYLELAHVQIKTLLIIVVKCKQKSTLSLISHQKIESLLTFCLVISLFQSTLTLIYEISKNNIYNLSKIVESKLILTVSQILTGNARKVLKETPELKPFLNYIQQKDFEAHFEKQSIKVMAIQALSNYRFKEELRDVVGGFVKDKVLKHYLQWGNSKIKVAVVETAFFLYAKKGKNIAYNQLMEVLDKLIRVGVTDSNQTVRLKIYKSISHNLSKHSEFMSFFGNTPLLSYLFQSVEDSNPEIRLTTLKIICTIYKKNPSVMITPFLKKLAYNFVYHLSSNFKYYGDKQHLIQSISLLIEYAPNVVQNYIDNLLKILLKYLEDRGNYEGLELIFFQMVKVLTKELPKSIIPYIEHFCFHLIVAMHDKLNPRNRSLSLKTFLSLIQHCGYVVIPYFMLPQLKDSISYLLGSDLDAQSRNDVMRIIGALGVFDSIRSGIILNIYQSQKSKSRNNRLEKCFTKMNIRCNFLKQRKKIISTQSQKSYFDQQLTSYYGQILLLENNLKKLSLLQATQKQTDTSTISLPTVFHSQFNFSQWQTSSTNFNLVIIRSLFQILKDSSLQQKHQLTLEVLTQLVEIMGNELQTQLKTMIPALLYLISYYQEVMGLILIIGDKCDISLYVTEITIFTIKKIQNMDLTVKVLELLSDKYSLILRHIMELVVDHLYSIVSKNSINNAIMIKVSHIYKHLRQFLEPYLNIILPQILNKFFKKNSQNIHTFIDLIMLLAISCPSIIQYMSIIIQSLTQVLNFCGDGHKSCKPCPFAKIGNCIVLFICSFKQNFASYLPLIHSKMIKQEQHELYRKTIRFLNQCTIGNYHQIFTSEELERILVDHHKRQARKQSEMPKFLKKIDGAEEIINQFDPSGKKLIDQDWMEWLKKTAIFLLKKSPSMMLRTCAVLAEEYNELALELYNLAFFHFWELLLDEQKKILIDNIKKLLTCNPKPLLNVRKTILNLAEFMSRKKCSFELSSSLLSQCAKQASVFAKNMYYKEQQFEANPEKALDGLIEVYMKLGEPENAQGLFKIATQLGIKIKIQWYKRIGKYQEAYQNYKNIKSKEQEYLGDQLKCLGYMSDELFLEQFQKINKKKLNELSDSGSISVLATKAYASLQKWDQAQQSCSSIEENTVEKQFWKSILQIKNQNYVEAQRHINRTRKLLYDKIPSIFNFSTSSEYFNKFIKIQNLFELEEIVMVRQKEIKIQELLKKQMDQIERDEIKTHFQKDLKKIKKIWNDKLIGFSKNSKTWEELSVARSLLFTKLQYFEFYYDYCSCLISENKNNKCRKIIKQIKRQLQGDQYSKQKVLMLQLLEIKMKLSNNEIGKQSIFETITFLKDNQAEIDLTSSGDIYQLCGQYLFEGSSNNQKNKQYSLQLFEKASNLASNQNYWYLLSINVLEYCENAKPQNPEKYIEKSLIALTNSLKIKHSSNEQSIEGYLKLLYLLSKYHKLKKIQALFDEEYKKIPVEGWIHVVPQMIAQLYQGTEETQTVKLLKKILKNLGEKHPQALLYSLNFSLKTKIPERIKPTLQILNHIKKDHQNLTQQIEKISSELGKAAIKLKEFWYDGIEAAWALHNQSKNPQKVISYLKELCEDVLERATSNSEISFHQQFRNDILQGYNILKAYEQYQEPIFISQFFEIFYTIYKKVKDSFENLKKVYLKNVAPYLVEHKKYQSTIPGLFAPNKKCVKITGFNNELSVLASKQRPRKLTVFGDDGKEYNFLLKGRQDLRLDERVMQFLNLANDLLISKKQVLKKDLEIVRYSIIPLSTNTGLIGWVQNCDTLNELIKQYRISNKIRIYVQKQFYQKICQDYAYLPAINKLQIFKSGLESTQGKDLQKILWLNSESSEIWVQKRNNYINSLATMSMVGYILGLGDRHPSNIMIKRDNGKIVHIDFGDCFEVAVLRQKFPQRVPFRLTRMLQKAMGIPGIHGVYRHTCQKVMEILRQNRKILFSVLQTFAKDPIISWKLTNEEQQDFQKVTLSNQKMVQKSSAHFQYMSSIMSALKMELEEKKEAKKDLEEHPQKINIQNNQYQINDKAYKSLQKIKLKLSGNQFDNKQKSVKEQVQKLIFQAISHNNICQSWPGWCPFW